MRAARTCIGVAGLAACIAATAPALAMDRDPAPFIARLESEGDRNRVLNEMEIGTRYFWSEDFGNAAQAFDSCIQNIELVFLNDESVTKARSLWYEEGAKNFKGEPYERAMVYYYRGLVFLAQGDYENARAAFRQGTMQDAFAEEEQDQADFALLYYLEAWASHLNGDRDLRDETLKKVEFLNPDLPAFADGDDTLVVVESGLAPRKLGDGANHSYFVYRRGKGFTENGAVLAAASGDIPLYPVEDIYRQASTRGGREVDQIYMGQARFKRGVGDAGSALAQGAQVFSSVGGSGGIAAGIGAVGAIASLLSSKAKVKADTRTWSSLPDSVHVRSFSSANAQIGGAGVRFLANGQPSDLPEQSLKLIENSRGHKLALVRRP